MDRPLEVFYDPRQHTDANSSYSPSAGKPAQVVESWKRLDVPLKFMPVEPTTVEQFALAHDRAYVEGVLSGRLHNGFGNRLPAVAATFPWTTGSMVSAAIHVARAGGVAISPTSGFHHAGYERAAGFCTLNGLMVAARTLQELGLARRVGILDVDAHYGDGTAEIISRLKRDDVRHWSFGAHHSTPAHAAAFLQGFPWVLASFRDCDVVLYQAGADPFVGDPLGGVLTKQQLRLRDRAVFTFFASVGIPLVWNLAGGYARDPAGTIRPVLDIHDATLEECWVAYSGRP